MNFTIFLQFDGGGEVALSDLMDEYFRSLMKFFIGSYCCSYYDLIVRRELKISNTIAYSISSYYCFSRNKRAFNGNYPNLFATILSISWRNWLPANL